MSEALSQHGYPRQLTASEHDLLFSILPEDRKAYALYRTLVSGLTVIGEGRRGTGELILGHPDDLPNFDVPLAPVFAYGVIETSTGIISITIRERSQDQISVEFVNSRSETIPAVFEEFRRWTYSNWHPGLPCPQCRHSVREIHFETDAQEQFTIAICPEDQRLWVYHQEQQLVRLIPITNFYNELMLTKNIRDPNIALNSKLLFLQLHTYSDAEILQAFLSYNKLKTKVEIRGEFRSAEKYATGFFSKLKTLFIPKHL